MSDWACRAGYPSPRVLSAGRSKGLSQRKQLSSLLAAHDWQPVVRTQAGRHSSRLAFAAPERPSCMRLPHCSGHRLSMTDWGRGS